MSSEDSSHLKDVEFYAAGVAAWYNTALEHDKSVFALSAGGIGLLITLLTTVGLSNVVLLVLYITAIISFLVSLVAVLAIFRRNRTHIEQVFKGESPALDPILTVLDHVAVLAFGMGAVLAAVIGISTAAISYSNKEKSVSAENKSTVSTEQLTKSFNGVANLQQQTAASSPPPVVPPAPVQPPATSAETASSSGSGK